MGTQELQEVYSTVDQTQVVFVKSILTAAKVDYCAQGDIHSAIEARFPVRFLVPSAQTAKAKQALLEAGIA